MNCLLLYFQVYNLRSPQYPVKVFSSHNRPPERIMVQQHVSKKYIAALIFVCHSLSLSSPLNQITGGRSRCCTALFSICLRLENQLKNNISVLLFFGVDESSVNLIEKNGLLLFLRLKNCRMSFFFPSLYLIFFRSLSLSQTRLQIKLDTIVNHCNKRRRLVVFFCLVSFLSRKNSCTAK